MHDKGRLRTVAVIDAAKGLTILAIGLGILNAHSHVLEAGGVHLLRLLDINPTLVAAQKFLAMLQAADSEHGLLMIVAGSYAAMRFIEAYGLWNVRGWARWMGIISSGVYVPFELYYLVKGPSVTTFGVLAVNAVVLWLLWPRRRENR